MEWPMIDTRYETRWSKYKVERLLDKATDIILWGQTTSFTRHVLDQCFQAWCRNEARIAEQMNRLLDELDCPYRMCCYEQVRVDDRTGEVHHCWRMQDIRTIGM